MSKTVLIMRHAKSSWANENLTDHDRPLNDRGLRDAPRMGRFLAYHRLLPEVIFSSTAVRAKTTAILVAETLGLTEIVQHFEELYLAPPSVYLSMILNLPEECKCALFIGHNPGMESLVGMMGSGQSSMPTGAIGVVEFQCEDWSEVSLDTAECLHVWRPKEIDWNEIS